MVLLKLWDYAQTIFRSEELQTSYAEAEIGPQKTEMGARKSTRRGLLGRYKSYFGPEGRPAGAFFFVVFVKGIIK